MSDIQPIDLTAYRVEHRRIKNEQRSSQEIFDGKALRRISKMIEHVLGKCLGNDELLARFKLASSSFSEDARGLLDDPVDLWDNFYKRFKVQAVEMLKPYMSDVGYIVKFDNIVGFSDLEYMTVIIDESFDLLADQRVPVLKNHNHPID